MAFRREGRVVVRASLHDGVARLRGSFFGRPLWSVHSAPGTRWFVPTPQGPLPLLRGRRGQWQEAARRLRVAQTTPRAAAGPGSSSRIGPDNRAGPCGRGQAWRSSPSPPLPLLSLSGGGGRAGRAAHRVAEHVPCCTHVLRSGAAHRVAERGDGAAAGADGADALGGAAEAGAVARHRPSVSPVITPPPPPPPPPRSPLASRWRAKRAHVRRLCFGAAHGGGWGGGRVELGR
jgi:hypothetical protein